MQTRILLGALGLAGATIVLGQMDVFAGKSSPRDRAGVDAGLPAPLPAVGEIGPDVITCELPQTRKWESDETETAYSFATTSQNIGDMDLDWVSAPSDRHPVISQNMFRLLDGRFEHIGQAWLKHSFCALQLEICGPCGGGGGCPSYLGPGCSDPYSAARNGDQGGLGPKWQVNAHDGEFEVPWHSGEGTAGSYRRRLRVLNSDLALAGALYFLEGQYVAKDDAAWANQNNNASYQQVSVSPGSYNLTIVGSTQRQKPGIEAWLDNDPTVTLVEVQIDEDGVPSPLYDDGQLIVGYNVYDNGDGTWDYEYAVYNKNSHRSGQGFAVPVPAGVTITDVGFHDVDYHSGDGIDGVNFDGTDWPWVIEDAEIRWSTDTFADNENANALRWATVYNFRFTADAAPAETTGRIDLFRPDPDHPDYNSAEVTLDGPSAAPCPEDFDGSGAVDTADLISLLAEWGPCPGCPEDLDGSGAVDTADLIQLLAAWGPC